jgi:glycosyltransferase involved in cell wall biosynthesis
VNLASVTPLILTHNEAPNIERALAGLAWAKQIVVIDSFSTDTTVAILAADPRVELFQRSFDSFARQCNFGLEQIESEWVLSLDADYICEPNLARELERFPAEPAQNGFRSQFRYCVCGRPLRATLYPPRVVLYRRSCAQYEDDGHAQRVRVRGIIGNLQSRILHDDRKPLDRWLAAQRRYAEQETDKLLATPFRQLSTADRIRRRKWLAPLIVPMYCLFVRGLILDGLPGLVYSLQRTYAELLLSMMLLDRELNNPLARNEHIMPPPDEVGH